MTAAPAALLGLALFVGAVALEGQVPEPVDPPSETANEARVAGESAAEGGAAEAATGEAPATEAAKGFQPVEASLAIVAEVGAPLTGGDPKRIVTNLGLPVTDALGRLSFTGTWAPVAEDGTPTAVEEGFVWQNGAVTWRHGDAPEAKLLGTSPQMGSSEPGRFLFRTQMDGEAGLWSQEGKLLRNGEPAPGFGPDSRVLFLRRPRVIPSGDAYWIAEVRDRKGPRGKVRALFRRSASGTTAVLLRSDDALGDAVVDRPRGLDLAYDVSPSGSHWAQVAYLTKEDGKSRQVVVVDGVAALWQGDATGDLDRQIWGRFHSVSIDDAGHTLVSASTSGSPVDSVVALDGRVLMREGEQVAGRTLRPPAKGLAISSRTGGRATIVWSVGGMGEELVFDLCDVEDPATATLVLESRTRIDLDGDGAVDGSIERLADLGHGDPLAAITDTHLFLAVQLDRADAAGMHEAIVSLPLPACPPEEDGAAPPQRTTPG